jgi:hypothetical protein
MDPIDLLKAAPELKRIAEIIVGGVPAGEIVKAIVLPSANALGERMKRRVERLFEKTGKMVQEAGITPQPVADKLVIEIVRNAAVEDNEDLLDMWAALLANGASPENAGKVRPGFIAILKQMAPDEAALLNWIYVRLDPNGHRDLPLQELYSDLGFGLVYKAAETRILVCLGGLESVGLVALANVPPAYSFGFLSQDREPNFSSGYPRTLPPRGLEFVQACRPPKPEENG